MNKDQIEISNKTPNNISVINTSTGLFIKNIEPCEEEIISSDQIESISIIRQKNDGFHRNEYLKILNLSNHSINVIDQNGNPVDNIIESRQSLRIKNNDSVIKAALLSASDPGPGPGPGVGCSSIFYTTLVNTEHYDIPIDINLGAENGIITTTVTLGSDGVHTLIDTEGPSGGILTGIYRDIEWPEIRMELDESGNFQTEIEFTTSIKATVSFTFYPTHREGDLRIGMTRCPV